MPQVRTQKNCEGFQPAKDLTEERSDGSGKTANIREHLHGARPTERKTTGCGVYDHQARVDDQRDGKTASGQRKMRATIEYVSRGSANGEFENEKRHFAVLEQSRHERVAFGGDVQTQPKERELGVEPVESKQEQAFGKCTHGFSVPTLFKLLLITSEPPSFAWGSMTSREERDSFYAKIKGSIANSFRNSSLCNLCGLCASVACSPASL